MRIVVHKSELNDPDNPIAKGLSEDIIKSVTKACEKRLRTAGRHGSELIARITHDFGKSGVPTGFVIDLSSYGVDDDAGRDWYFRRFEEAEYNNELFKSKAIAPSYLKYGGGVREIHQPIFVQGRYQHGATDASDKANSEFLNGFLMSEDQIRRESEYAIAVICSAIRDACD